MTLDGALEGARARLAGVADTPAADARILLAFALECERSWLLAHGDAPLEPATAARFEALLAERELGTPLPYLTGEAWFYGRRFAITRDVLVPRPESELLVEDALAFLRERAAGPGASVCDVGTGSGILAITLACEAPAVRVLARDVSPAALAVAERNARALGVAERVAFQLGDALENLAGAPRFDCLIANLPYLPSAALPGRPNPLSFEPRLALDGGPDGLDLYRRLLAGAPARLAPGAALFLEAAPPTAHKLAALVRAAFPAARVAIGRDYAGLERIVSALSGEPA